MGVGGGTGDAGGPRTDAWPHGVHPSSHIELSAVTDHRVKDLGYMCQRDLSRITVSCTLSFGLR